MLDRSQRNLLIDMVFKSFESERVTEVVIKEDQRLGEGKPLTLGVWVEGREVWSITPVGNEEPLHTTATDGGSDRPKQEPWPDPNDRRVAC